MITKLNETFSAIKGEKSLLKAISDYLKVKIPGGEFDPLIKRGFKSPFHYFTKVQNEQLIVLNGHLPLIKHFGIDYDDSLYTESIFSREEVVNYLKDVIETLPFKPYDYQLRAVAESLLKNKQIAKCCTSSGKSVIISLIAEFYRRKGLKGLLLVPNINLLTQFHDDIKSYNLTELYNDARIIGAGETERIFDKSLIISTWQSLQEKYTEDLNFDDLDFIIGDEVHRLAAEVPGGIIKNLPNCKFKFGFTGTLPEDPIMKMELLGIFGQPKTYITSRELIERGLGTPVKINSIILKYPKEEIKEFNSIVPTGRSKNKFPNQLNYIKEHPRRRVFVNNLVQSLRPKGNMLVLFQHTDHGKDMFIDYYKSLGIEVENKDITGKKSFEFQSKYGVYFLNGEDNAETREKTRKILEVPIYRLPDGTVTEEYQEGLEPENAVLFANVALLSTGVSIKRLHNLIMASPLKSYTTVAQSIGRLMRLHKDKKIAYVFDIIDDFGTRKPGGPFIRQYQHRLATSYHPEEFPITEINHDI